MIILFVHTVYSWYNVFYTIVSFIINFLCRIQEWLSTRIRNDNYNDYNEIWYSDEENENNAPLLNP